MAETKEKDQVYVAVGKVVCGVSIPIRDANGKEVPEVHAKTGEPKYSRAGNMIIKTRLISFVGDQINPSKVTTCVYATSDEYEIEHLDKKCKDSTSPIVSKEAYDKMQNPMAAKYRDENKMLKKQLAEADARAVESAAKTVEANNKVKDDEIAKYKEEIKNLKKGK